MADPLSLATGIIAVVSAAEGITKTISKKVRLLRNAPNEILALNTELSDLIVTLRNVSNYISSSSTNGAGVPQEVLEQMTSLVDRAKEQVLQLDQLVHYHFIKSGSLDGDCKFYRLRWVRAKDTVEHHRQAIRDIKQNIVLQLLLINSSYQSRINLAVDSISVVLSLVQGLQENDTAYSIRQLGFADRLVMHILDEKDISRTCSQSGIGPANQPCQIHTERKVVRPTESLCEKSIVGIKPLLPRPRHYSCAFSCKCNCHKGHSLKSPSILDRIIGSLFLRYTGQSHRTFYRCSLASCQNQSPIEARVQYFLPLWLLKKMIDLQFRVSSFHELCISLTVRGVYSHNDEFFHLINSDDEKGLQRLLSSGGASPNDVDSYSGANGLAIALNARSFRVCRTLLDSGADPRFEPTSGVAVIHLAWSIIHCREHDENILESIRQLFPRTEVERAEDCLCSRLHQAILGHSSYSLEEELAVDGLDLNKRDWRGYTPLIFAIRRQDNTAVRLLLDAGVDPDMSTPDGCSPLHFASASDNIACVRMLLNAGASAGHADARGSTALHYAAQNSASLDLLKVLISAGNDISKKDSTGATALASAVSTNKRFSALKIKFLLNHGADINVQDAEYNTPLLISVYRASNAVTKLLLQLDADYTIVNDRDNTILHAAAGYGNLETLAILRAADLVHVNPHAVNSSKKTAFEIAQQRDTKPEGFIDFFLVLLFEIRNRNDYSDRQQIDMDNAVVEKINGDESGNSSEADEFYDAEE